MDSSTKKSGKNRTSKKGSRGRRNTPVKISNLGSFSLQKATLWGSPTVDEQWSLNINGYWTGTIKSLLELLPSTVSSSFERQEMDIYKLSLGECVVSLIPADNTTKSSLSQGNPHCLMCLYEMLSSRLVELCQDYSGSDREYFSRSTTQLCVIFKGLLEKLKQQQMPVSSSLLPCPHQSPK